MTRLFPVLLCLPYYTSCYNNIHGQRGVQKLFNSLSVEHSNHYYYIIMRSKDDGKMVRKKFIFSHFVLQCTRLEVEIVYRESKCKNNIFAVIYFCIIKPLWHLNYVHFNCLFFWNYMGKRELRNCSILCYRKSVKRSYLYYTNNIVWTKKCWSIDWGKN